MANLTLNTKKYGQISLNTKTHSDPLIIPQVFIRLHKLKRFPYFLRSLPFLLVKYYW